MATTSAWRQLSTNRNWLAFWFMLPAMAFLVLFLAYPLGLGVSLSFMDSKIGEPGKFVGGENYEWLLGTAPDWGSWFSSLFSSKPQSLPGDAVFWLAVFNTCLYTVVASAAKFGLGLYLALLLNERLPFKALVRAIVLIPFLVTNARQLGMAGKFLFPIPDRGLKERIHRITAKTVLVWGDSDRIFPAPYAQAFKSHIKGAELVSVPERSTMMPKCASSNSGVHWVSVRKLHSET